jgi:hypothetical protein
MGRLTIHGRVARGATGKIRGRVHFGRGLRRFTARIRGGRIRVDVRLRGAKRAKRARVVLVYRGTRRFRGARLKLRVTRRGARVPSA